MRRSLQGSLVLLRESRSEDISEVSGRILSKEISLTARNTSSLVIDRLCDQARNEDMAFACLYCDFLAQQEQITTNMMGVILKQLVGLAPHQKLLLNTMQCYENTRHCSGRYIHSKKVFMIML